MSQALQAYLARTSVIIEGNLLRFDLEQADDLISKIDEIFTVGSKSDVKILQTHLLEEFQNSSVCIEEPKIDISSCPFDIRKHFMMVSPHKAPLFMWPNELIKQWANWEALRRALDISMAEITVHNANDEKSPVYTSCRDSYAMVNNKAYFSDAEDKHISENLRRDAEVIPSLIQRLDDCTSIKDFFINRDQETYSVKGVWFDGGNLIIHHKSKTVFWGTIGDGRLLEYELASAKKFEDTLNSTQEDNWSIFPVPLAHMRNNIDLYKMASGDATPFYHMDMGMSEPLENGEILIYPGMTHDRTYQIICDIVGRDNIIPITYKEGKDCSANLVSNGMNVIMSNPSERLSRLLNNRGYQVICAKDFGVDSFSIETAYPHCLTNMVTQPSCG